VRAAPARRRHRLRIAFGGLVALAAIVASDQRGLLAVGAAGSPESAAAADAAPLTSLAGGFGALGARLRMGEPVDVRPTEVQGVVAVGPPPAPAAGDVAIATLPSTFQRHELSAPPPPPPVALRPSRYDQSVAAGGTWALIIGINDYPGVRYDLRSAVNDANDTNEALAKLGVTNDRRLVLRDRQADADTIRAALDWLGAHAGPDATMVFFYAGHVQKLDARTEALVGADGGVIPDVELAAMLDRSAARRAWVVLAACYSGGFTEVVKPGRILTAAAPSDRVAYENESFGRSYLVEYMIRRAMLGNDITTVEGAFAWATAELRRDFPDRLPVQQDSVGGDLDLKVPPPPRPAPSSQGSAPGSPPPPPAKGQDPQNPPPPDPDDGCAGLTAGVVRCE
jgi:hypothetical protein